MIECWATVKVTFRAMDSDHAAQLLAELCVTLEDAGCDQVDVVDAGLVSDEG